MRSLFFLPVHVCDILSVDACGQYFAAYLISRGAIYFALAIDGEICYNRPMRYVVTALLTVSVLASCSLMPVQTITRKELLTPTTYTAVDPSSYTDMMYYGADNTYDYFTRNSLRYRVLRSENAMPESARFSFNNWQGGKLYRDCLVTAVRDKLMPATTPTGTTTTSPNGQSQMGNAIRNWLQQRKTGTSGR